MAKRFLMTISKKKHWLQCNYKQQQNRRSSLLVNCTEHDSIYNGYIYVSKQHENNPIKINEFMRRTQTGITTNTIC